MVPGPSPSSAGRPLEAGTTWDPQNIAAMAGFRRNARSTADVDGTHLDLFLCRNSLLSALRADQASPAWAV